MKKRILFTMLFVVVFSLLAVFSVSAEEYSVVDNLGDPSWYTGNYELITDKTSKVVLSNGDGTYTAYPAYYVLKYSITVKDGVVTEAYVNGFDYSHINDNTEGVDYSLGAIYKIELPNGLTTVKNTYFGHNPKEPNVVEIVMPDSMTSISSHAFRETRNLKKVVFSKNLTSIGAYAFYRAYGLEEFVLPAGSDEYLDVSGENIFYECSSLKEADISTRKIKKIGSNFLSKCAELGKVTLSDTIEEIGGYFLFECPKSYLASNFLPTNLKTVGFQFLSSKSPYTNNVLYFPDGFEGFTVTHVIATERYQIADTTWIFLGRVEGTISLTEFHANSGKKLTLVFTKNTFSDLSGKIVSACEDGTLAYVGKTANTDDTDYWVQEGRLTINVGNASESKNKYKTDENGNTLYYVDSNSYKVIFCGGENVEVCYGVRSNVVNNEWGKQFTTPFAFDMNAHNEAGIHYDLTKVESIKNCGYDGVVSHTCVICDRVVNDVDVATGNHELTEVSACADKCGVCLKYVQKEVQNHNLDESITYENGYGKDGVYTHKCQNEGCSHDVIETASKLINFVGYSMPEYDGYGFVMTFQVNKNAISEYQRVENVSVNYGIFAVAGEKLGTNDILNQDGSANDFVVKAEINTEYDAFDFRLSGFETDTQKSALLCIGTYVINSNNEISYVQTEKVSDGDKYAYLSYNSIKALIDLQS